MVRTTLALAAIVAASPLFEAKADLPRLGIFRKKKDEAPAGEKEQAAKVKTLLDTLKNDLDEKKRLAAVEDLSGYDTRTHVDVLPGLLASLKADPSAAVRSAAAEAIGGLKPVVQTAGVALEQTNSSDPSDAVRKAAQAALWQYHLNGYRSAGAAPSQPQTAEPPLAKGKPKVAVAPPVPTPVKPPVKPPVVATPVSLPKQQGGVYPQTAEPPLAKPKVVAEAVQPPQPSLSVPALPVIPPPPPAPLVPPPK